MPSAVNPAAPPEPPTDPAPDEPPSGARPERWRRIAEMTCSFAYTLRLGEGGATTVDWVSGSITDLLGFTPAELAPPGAVRALLLDPDELEPVRAWLSRVKEGERIPLEHRLRTRDGGARWVRDHAGPVRDASGRVAFIDGAIVDITQRVRADAARARTEDLRRRSEQNFRTLIERSPDAVAVYQGAVVVYVNPRMLALLGYDTPEGIVGRGPLEFVHPEDRPMVTRRIQDYSLRGMETPPVEERFVRKDGVAVPVEVISIPIFFDEAPSTLVHARDLTERKRLEAQLVMADRLASVGRLAATVGHEINNPLAFVLANLELSLEGFAEGGPLDAARAREIAEMLREAREGAERVRHIVRDLKVFSRGESDEIRAVDPRRVIDSCISMAKGEIRHRARLVKRYGFTPRVLANEARLGQVLLNLLINAAHAIPEDAPGEHTITVTTGTDPRGLVEIEVHDTGSGIPDDVKKHIFEPFFTTKPGGAGTGLGLSICQNIVAALGGEITVESEVGKGTAFRVYLPAARDSEPPVSTLP
jgi:PAS domain S-box-containing protein